MQKHTKKVQAASEEREPIKAHPEGKSKKISDEILRSLWQDLLLGSAKQATEQVVGVEVEETMVMKAGQEISLKKKEKVEALKVSHHKEYFRKIENSQEISMSREQQMMQRRVEEIMHELQRIASTSREMSTGLAQLVVATTPKEIGQYHITFYEWMLLVLRNAREKMEEGANWLAIFSNKKKQKSYWNMYKKHGTTFGLSQERTASNQTA